MMELHSGFAAARQSERFHPLLLVGGYVLDFLVIHPFSDGNGRMSRLLTLLLLYQSGYGVGRFISLEQLIAETKETYYEALAVSTSGWHQDEQDLRPWLTYLLGVLIGAYGRFEDRVRAIGAKGSKTEAVKRFIRSTIADEFTIGDIRNATGHVVSNELIRRVLKELRDRGFIVTLERGRHARYRRISTDF